MKVHQEMKGTFALALVAFAIIATSASAQWLQPHRLTPPPDPRWGFQYSTPRQDVNPNPSEWYLREMQRQTQEYEAELNRREAEKNAERRHRELLNKLDEIR
jgi:hypothetical protein